MRPLRTVAAVVCLAATSVSAQTSVGSVRDNFVLAADLCAQVMLRHSPTSTTFKNAGFTYRAIDRGTNDYGIALGLDHFFDAPGGTVKASVTEPDQIAGLCRVLTTQMAENEAIALVGSLLSQRYPMTQEYGRGEWSIPNGGSQLIVTIRTIGTNHRYEAPGTIEISMTYPG